MNLYKNLNVWEIVLYVSDLFIHIFLNPFKMVLDFIEECFV